MGIGADLYLKRIIEDKTAKYQPLIGHAGAPLSETALHLVEALASKRPNLGRKRPRTNTHNQEMDKLALAQDKKIVTALLQQLSDLAASRLLQTLAHR